MTNDSQVSNAAINLIIRYLCFHCYQVVSPSDVQFKLAEDDKDEVVINLNSVPESLCLNTAAFIGVTVTFVMLLIVASIVIVFLWLRIRTLTRKNLL